MHFHPWRSIRPLPQWRVVFRRLPDGMYGYTHSPSKTIAIERSLNQVERRCTIAHELEHIRRGDASACSAKEERSIHRTVARQLIPLVHLIDALLWVRDSHDLHELASDLWVDLDTLKTRLENLTQHEHDEINRRLGDLQALMRRSA